MVTISQRDFNMDMEKYLSKRVEYEPRKQKVQKQPEQSEEFKKEEEAYLQQSDKGFFQKILDVFVGDEAEQELYEDEMSEEEYVRMEQAQSPNKRRRGIFSRITGVFTDDSEEMMVEEIELDEPLVADDLKEVLKILNGWLTHLPPKKMKEFKASEDYNTYRETLKKYKLIKQ